MAKKKEGTNRMGKRTGYDLVDGVYHIAPMYTRQFEELWALRRGIEDMLAIVIKHAAKDLEPINKAYTKLWCNLADDIGLVLGVPGKEWNYYTDGTIKQKEKAE